MKSTAEVLHVPVLTPSRPAEDPGDCLLRPQPARKARCVAEYPMCAYASTLC